jgi:hypothetical protein
LLLSAQCGVRQAVAALAHIASGRILLGALQQNVRRYTIATGLV